MLLDYCSNIKNLHGNTSGKVKKLINSLNDKENYVLHYRNLKLYLDLGLKLKKVHRAAEFTQRRWLKSYIDFNTEMRKNAKNSSGIFIDMQHLYGTREETKIWAKIISAHAKK